MNLHRKRPTLTEIFDAANRANGQTIQALSASAAAAPSPIRDAQGRVDMAAVFDRENGSTLKTLSAGNSAIDATAVNEDSVPDEILLLPWGAQPDPLGYIVVNANTLATLPQIQSALDAITVPIFDPGDPTKLEKTNAAVQEPFQVGSGRVVVRDKDGIYLTDIQWLDQGREALAEFPYISPTVWLDGDLANGGQKFVAGVKSAVFNTSANQITMLQVPKLVNLSASAYNAGYNRLIRTMNADNAGGTEDRVKLIKTFAASGRFPRHPNGESVTEQQMSLLPIDALRNLFGNTPVSTPQNKEEIIRVFSATGKFPAKGEGQNFTTTELHQLSMEHLRLLAANIFC